MGFDKEEALKCLSLSKSYYHDGSMDQAIKFARKSQRIYPLPETEEWLRKLLQGSTTKNPQMSSRMPEEHEEKVDSVNQAHKRSAQGKPPRKPSKGENESDMPSTYSVDQLEAVKSFQKTNKNDFYAVLRLEKTCSEADIKKAYRKMALLFHPDKNRAPGADEAFKAVGRAFAVLNDKTKRSQYDMYGAEIASPEFASNSFSSFPTNPFDELGRRYPEFFEAQFDPEDIFRMFFSELASPRSRNGGFRFQTFRPRSSRRQDHQHTQSDAQKASLAELFVQLIPFFILLFLSLLNQLLSAVFE